MKVLFISSGNKNNEVKPLVKAQGDSLEENGCKVYYYTVNGKGIKGYLKQIPHLRKYLKSNSYDIIHAHFSFSGFVAALAGANPLVVSLMGSDIYSSYKYKYFIYPFKWFFWDSIVVKSVEMKKALGFLKVKVLPNGVDINKFRPINKDEAVKKLKWDSEYQHILFAANPSRPEKNFNLAKEAYEDISGYMDVQLHALVDVPHDLVPYYINASDVIILTSLWEGSPNVIKEAMACNKPIVTTDVGDVNWLLKNLNGCFVVNNNQDEISGAMSAALKYSKMHKETEGRKRIIKLRIDSNNIAKRLITIYQNITDDNKP